MNFESDVWMGLDEGSYDADTILPLYWRVREEVDQNWRITRAGPLDNLMPEVMEAMSHLLPSSPIDVAQNKPTKLRSDLMEERFERARVEDPKPVVVMGRPEGGEAKLLDGHHRFYKAKDAGRETLPRCMGDPYYRGLAIASSAKVREPACQPCFTSCQLQLSSWS